MNHSAKVLFKLGLAVALVVLWTPAAGAQTADGQTPAVEDVCEGESGAAFGLCNAYCEAMDCDFGFEEDPKPHASEKACLQVKYNYMKLSGKAELPCEPELCPPAGPLGLDCPCQVEDDLCDENLNLECGENFFCVRMEW